MTREKKQPEISGSPAVLPEEAALATEPAIATITVAAEGADNRELEAWNAQVRRRMRHKSRRSFLGWGAGDINNTVRYELCQDL